jgi:hypothetical protein
VTQWTINTIIVLETIQKLPPLIYLSIWPSNAMMNDSLEGKMAADPLKNKKMLNKRTGHDEYQRSALLRMTAD